MAASRFVEVSDKEISEIKINLVLKNTKGLCKNTKTIVRLRLSDYRGIYSTNTPILYSTNFWHSSKVQIENCNHGTVRGNKATALQLSTSTTLQLYSPTTLQP
jgi:predicted YcjX-like family ATPase